ncbi:MAG: EAL domain-containing protein [Pseudomonadota bacterium]
MDNLVKKMVGKVTKTRLLSEDNLLFRSIHFKSTAHKQISKNAPAEPDEYGAQIALNSISDAVFYTDILGNVNYLNVAAEKLTGWTSKAAYGRPSCQVFNIINGTTRKPVPNPVLLVLETNLANGLAADTVLIKRDGSEVSIEDSSSPIHDEKGQLTGVVVVFHDVSEAKAMSMKMAHLAQHDFLTNLPNRVLLNDRIAQAIATADRNDTKLALLFLDLDNFKHINDSLGHATGDKLLQSVSKRLSDCVRNADTVSRQGGDEFILLLADIKQDQDAALTAQKILDELKMPYLLNKCNLHISTSIGISVYPNDGVDAETLIKSADTAMYYAKDKGRANYQFFKSEMNTRVVQRLMIEAHLRIAVEKQQFFLNYQSKVNLKSQKITGVEVLIRWNHDEWGDVAPKKFINIAEDSGLIIPIGKWVLREACKQARIWLDNGLPRLNIAINISAKEFLQKDFVEGVRAVLIETQLPAENLELEITETVLMRDALTSTIILQQLKQIGVKLAVDDFGTGYSSLSYLKQFPIDVLKIDQSFIKDIESVLDDGTIVNAIICMGNSLDLKVVAEGIENQDQLDFLNKHHCEEGQGYLFSPAVNAEQFALLLIKNK